MIRFRGRPLLQVFIVLLIVADLARGDLAGHAAREVAERLGRGLDGTASHRAARHVIDVARAVTPHRNVGPPLVPLAQSSSRALATLAPRNARRLAMLAEEGTLARSGRWGELLAVIERHGDRAMEFVWRHKGALTVSTILGSFLAQPEAFLGGRRELVGDAASEATRPFAAAAEASMSWWGRTAGSVVVASLALPAMMVGWLLSVRVVRHFARRSHR